MLTIFVSLLLVAVAAEMGLEVRPTPPAFIWGVELPHMQSIFQAISPEYFAALLRPLLKDHMIIAYMEQELTAKDLSCTETDCYAYLRRMTPRTYYSKVQEPAEVLARLLNEQRQELIHTERYNMMHLPCRPKSIHVFFFKDNNLTEHDNFMQLVSENLKNCSLVQLYTAHGEPMNELMDRAQWLNELAKWEELQEPDPRGTVSHYLVENFTKKITGIPKAAVTVVRHAKAIVAMQKIVLADEINNQVTVHYKRYHIYPNNATTLDVEQKHASDIKKGLTVIIGTHLGPLRLKILPVIGNWRIASLTFKNSTFMPGNLFVYSNKYSFCCMDMTAFSSNGSRLTIYSFSMDIVLVAGLSATDPNYHPKPCWQCEEYLTPGISQAIFTVVILLFLFGVGISMFLEMGSTKQIPSINDPEPYLKPAVDH